MPATLQGIKDKVRRITRTPDVEDLTNAQLEDYINDFVLYDFPEEVRLFTNRPTFTWYTVPNRPNYPLAQFVNNGFNCNFTDALNQVIDFYNPVYVGGFQIYLTQDQTEFFSLYPKNNTQQQIGTGTGAAIALAGTLTNAPIIPGTVTFASADANNNQLVGADTNEDGLIVNATVASQITGTINYLTGAFNIVSVTAAGANQPIFAEYVAYQPSRPQVMMFFNNTFSLRPIPDRVYRVEIEVGVRPTALMDTGFTVPELEQWWQYIAWGSAKKIFEDRMDDESIVKMTPEFKKQELLVLRRTSSIYTKERASTIYTQQASPNAAWWNYWNNF